MPNADRIPSIAVIGAGLSDLYTAEQYRGHSYRYGGAVMLKWTSLLITVAFLGSSCSDQSHLQADAVEGLGKHYPHIAQVLTGDFDIPGLDDGYVPQGIAWCDASRSYFLTLYHSPQTAESPRMSSILVQIDEAGISQRHLTLEEPDGEPHHGHVGGVAVSRNHIWIASSKRVHRYCRDAVNSKQNGESIRAERRLHLDSRASHITIHDEWLWVGEFARHDKPGNQFRTAKHHHVRDRSNTRKYAWASGYRFDPESGELLATSFNPDHGLRPDRVISMRQEVQGMSFIDREDGVGVVLSISYGNNPSKLASYVLDLQSPPHAMVEVPNWDPIPVWFLDSMNHVRSIEAPRGAEEIAMTPLGLAIVFEAGAIRYRSRWSGYLERRVLIVDTKILFPDN